LNNGRDNIQGDLHEEQNKNDGSGDDVDNECSDQNEINDDNTGNEVTIGEVGEAIFTSKMRHLEGQYACKECGKQFKDRS